MSHGFQYPCTTSGSPARLSISSSPGWRPKKRKPPALHLPNTVVYGVTHAVIHTPSPHDSKPRSLTMNKHLTSAQTTSITGAIIALLALIVFRITRSRREI